MEAVWYIEDQLETVLTVLFVRIGGLLAAMAYAIFGSKIRQRLHDNSVRTQSAWVTPHFWALIGYSSFIARQKILKSQLYDKVALPQY